MTSWTVFALVLAFACFTLTQAAPETCANDVHSCLAGDHAACHQGHCKCNDGYHGLPDLRCVNKDYHVCTIMNDPRANIYNGTGGAPEVSFPCRFQVTDVTIKRENNFWCRSRIFAYGWRFLGKIYLIGYDIRLDWDGDTVDRYTLSIKAYGKIQNDGSLTWDLLTRHSRFQGGDKWQRESISLTAMDVDLGGNNHFGIDPTNNRVQFYSTVCGVDTAFRLPDPVSGIHQVQMPGLLVAVHPDVVFNDVDGGVCLTPGLNAQVQRDKLDSTLPVDEAFLFNLAAYRRGQSFPKGPKNQCTGLQAVTSSCTNKHNRNQALFLCNFILRRPKFLRCFSEQADSSDAVDLLSDCLKAFCFQDKSTCEKVKEKLREKLPCTSPDKASEANVLLSTPCPGTGGGP